jgi:hypothetical protein
MEASKGGGEGKGDGLRTSRWRPAKEAVQSLTAQVRQRCDPGSVSIRWNPQLDESAQLTGGSVTSSPRPSSNPTSPASSCASPPPSPPFSCASASATSSSTSTRSQRERLPQRDDEEEEEEEEVGEEEEKGHVTEEEDSCAFSSCDPPADVNKGRFADFTCRLRL